MSIFIALRNLRAGSPLAKHFIVLSLLSLLSIVILVGFSLWFAYKTYNTQSYQIHQTLENQAERISTIFTDTLDYNAQSMLYMGKQIEKNGGDKQFINSLLQSYHVADSGIVSYGTFNWVDNHQNLTVSSSQGIIANPENLSDRDYIPTTISAPFKIQLGSPVYGAICKLWAIPAGLGVTDSKGNYLGSLITGFAIEDLIKRLKGAITQSGVTFMLFDKNLDLIATSSHFSADSSLVGKLQLALAKKHTSAGGDGIVYTPTLSNNELPFSYYKSLEKYPYTFVTLYDRGLSDDLIDEAIFKFCVQCTVIASLILFLLYITRKLLVSPIITLSAVADDIAQGKLDTPIPEFYSSEINNLAKQLQNIIADKKQLNEAHNHIKTAKESLEENVLERTTQLQKALQARSEFLNNISHEVRLPVQCVIGYSETLDDCWNELAEKDKRMAIHQLKLSSYRLLDLVNNLLDLSQFQAGKMVINLEKANLEDIVTTVINDCRPLYLNQKDLIVRLVPPAISTIAVFDRGRIMQVVRNLLVNAIKFTDKGNITATISHEDFSYGKHHHISGIKFSLRDEGKGVPEAELRDIFTPFIQSTRTKTGAGGTGLGLSICNEIITSHHGIIWAENNKDGKGCTFNFVIPLFGKI